MEHTIFAVVQIAILGGLEVAEAMVKKTRQTITIQKIFVPMHGDS